MWASELVQSRPAAAMRVVALPLGRPALHCPAWTCTDRKRCHIAAAPRPDPADWSSRRGPPPVNAPAAAPRLRRLALSTWPDTDCCANRVQNVRSSWNGESVLSARGSTCGRAAARAATQPPSATTRPRATEACAWWDEMELDGPPNRSAASVASARLPHPGSRTANASLIRPRNAGYVPVQNGISSSKSPPFGASQDGPPPPARAPPAAAAARGAGLRSR